MPDVSNNPDVDVVYEFEDEPEDAWHPEDTVAEQIRNLFSRCALLDQGRRLEEGDVDDTSRSGLMRELIERAETALRRPIGERARLRAYQILDDVELVLARIRRGE